MDKSDAEDWLEIGKIVAPQGLKGELRVVSTSDFPQRFIEPGTRWLRPPKKGEAVKIELLGGREIPGKNMYVVRLQGIRNREAAETFRGYQLLVAKSDRLPLDEGEYHVSDLIGLKVYHQLTGEIVGIVEDVFIAGHDILAVKKIAPELIETPSENINNKKQKKKKKPQAIMIPFVTDIVPVVDLEDGKIEIVPPPGLLEINQSSTENS